MTIPVCPDEWKSPGWILQTLSPICLKVPTWNSPTIRQKVPLSLYHQFQLTEKKQFSASGLQLFIAKDGTASLGSHEVKSQMSTGLGMFKQVVMDDRQCLQLTPGGAIFIVYQVIFRQNQSVINIRDIVANYCDINCNKYRFCVYTFQEHVLCLRHHTQLRQYLLVIYL